MQHKDIAFIGAGNMTRSIISGLVRNGYPASSIIASNPSLPKLSSLAQDFGIHTTLSNDDACERAQVVVLAVKPQLMADMCAKLKKSDGFANKLFVSIAAGLSVSRLQAMLQVPAPVIRVMPNTPSLLGKGLTGIFAPTLASNEQRQFVIEMMEKVGKVVCVDNEADINGVIAAAGSSPAYFFYILEAMADEAVRMGFTPTDARLMVQEAMLGAAEMVCQNPQLSLEELRQQVTSKGGTTAAAIESLTQSGLVDTMAKAMRAAVARAEQMSASL